MRACPDAHSLPPRRRLALALVSSACVLAGALGCGVPPRPVAPSAPAAVSVQLLAINDFHGNLEPPTGSTGLVNDTPAGGAEYLATHLRRALDANPDSLVVAAGDLVGASPLLSGVLHDEPTIEALDAMHLSVSSVGNHEFDEGLPELLRLSRGGCHPIDGCRDDTRFTGARFQYLAANVVQGDTRTTILPPTAIRTVGGVKVGFIGETLHGTPQIVSAAATRGLAFLDEATTANAYATQLKRQGADVVVLLIHEGGRQSPAGTLDPNGCERFSGAVEPIVSRLSADIPVVVSGHSHQLYNCTIDGHLVTSAGSNGRAVTHIRMEFDRGTRRFQRASAVNEIVTRDVPKDAAMTRLLGEFQGISDEKANRVVGSIEAAIARAPNAAGESSLGDVIADAQLAATKSAPGGGALVAFMNSGGVRADLVPGEPGAPADSHNVTYADLFRVQPFGNVITVMTMRGEAIARLLEEQFDNPQPGSARILQVSNGFTYRYRRNAPPGQRILRDSIQLNGRAIGPQDRVRVAAVDFLVSGGDGFNAFADATERIVVGPDIGALVSYFESHSPVAPGPRNRIVRID